MRLLIDNRITSDAMLTVNGEIDRYPAENMISNYLVEKTRFTDWIVIDLGTAQLVTAIGIIGHTYEITIQANTSDSWGSPAYSSTIAVGTNVKFISQTYRYWRILIDGSGGTDYIQYFYLGEFLQMPDPEPGSLPQRTSTDVSSTSIDGQIYTTRGFIFKEQEFSFPYALYADWLPFDTWWNSNDRVNSFIFVQFEDDVLTIPPYFARILEYKINDRDILDVSFELKIKEAK